MLVDFIVYVGLMMLGGFIGLVTAAMMCASGGKR